MKVFLILFCLLGVSCGSGSETVEKNPAPSGGDFTAKQAEWDTRLKRVVDRRCVRCHADEDWVKSARAFFAKKAAGIKTGNKSMPVPSSPEALGMSSSERKWIVDFYK